MTIVLGKVNQNRRSQEKIFKRLSYPDLTYNYTDGKRRHDDTKIKNQSKDLQDSVFFLNFAASKAKAYGWRRRNTTARLPAACHAG